MKIAEAEIVCQLRLDILGTQLPEAGRSGGFTIIDLIDILHGSSITSFNRTRGCQFISKTQPRLQVLVGLYDLVFQPDRFN